MPLLYGEMLEKEVVLCQGHPLITGRHRTTFEVTKDALLTPAGDCIIGICADKGAADLDPRFKELLARDDATLITRLSSGGEVFEVSAQGSFRFTLDHPTDMVWRRSNYVCGRTVGICSSHTARTLPRSLIAHLQQGKSLTVELIVTAPD